MKWCGGGGKTESRNEELRDVNYNDGDDYDDDYDVVVVDDVVVRG